MLCSNREFSLLNVAAYPARLEEVARFLAASQLGLDEDIGWFVLVHAGDKLVGCAGLAGNVIKCVAVEPALRGENLSARLLVEVQNLALSHGHSHLFLCTRPANLARFQRCGFWLIARCEDAVLLENTPAGVRRYARQLAMQRRPGARIGAIVMNANPFTLGHRYLAEQAAASCDWLHIFVVREEASFFPWRERLMMVRDGVAGLHHVSVHEGSPWILSRATFPGYFLRDSQQVDRAWSGLDLQIFRRYIAPALGITHRFVGTEPFCPVTRAYNQAMHYWLEQPQPEQAAPVTVTEIPRRCHDDQQAISASEVRRLLREQRMARIRELVPPTTFAVLAQRYCAETA